jgi:hypothetical protein
MAETRSQEAGVRRQQPEAVTLASFANFCLREFL